MWDWLRTADALQRTGKPFVLVTVIAVSGSAPREVGTRMLVESRERFHGTIGGGQFELRVIDDALAALAAHAIRTERYPLGAKAGQCCGGVVDVLFEPINAGPRLYLFGAGHVGQALCHVLSGTPFQVHLIDERAEWIDRAGVPESVHKHHQEWVDFVAEAPWESQQTYAAVMTFRHDMDEAIIANLLRRETRYLGLIGSERKWARFQERLSQQGFTASDLQRVHCPIGIPIGGKAPAEVAISVAAELLKTHYGR